MAEFTSQASGAYPGIPAISQDPNVQIDALENIKESLEIHERRTGNSEASFIRVQDLIDLGWIEKAGRLYVFLAPTITGSRSGNAALASLLTGLQELGLIIDETTA